MAQASSVSVVETSVSNPTPFIGTPLPNVNKTRTNLNFLVGMLFAVIAAYCFAGYGATDEQLKYIPPFRAGCQANTSHMLAWEYHNIAVAMATGRGYSNPFPSESGPTAWMPPMMPVLLAATIVFTGNSLVLMMMLWVGVQVLSLTMCFAFVRRLLPGRPAWLILSVFAVFLTMQFRLTFQMVHDYGLLMLLLNGCLYWDVRRDPLANRRSAAFWGLFGGAILLASPVIGLVWGGLTLRRGIRRGARINFVLAAVIAAIILSPWIARNAIVFGRFIPIKSNLFYELYQSQLETPDGIIDNQVLLGHPSSHYLGASVRSEYVAKGEMAFINDRKEAFLAGLRDDPAEFVRRVGNRFAAVFMIYRPFIEEFEPAIPGARTFFRIAHPLPAIACVVLIVGAPWRRLSRIQLTTVAAYLACLAPYVLIGYYDRYAFPLLGLKALLVVWAIERLIPWCNNETEQSAA